MAEVVSEVNFRICIQPTKNATVFCTRYVEIPRSVGPCCLLQKYLVAHTAFGNRRPSERKRRLMANVVKPVYPSDIDVDALPSKCKDALLMCCPGSKGGLFFPSSEGEQTWSVPLRAILYFIGMAWCFLGVAIIADLFMAAIDQVTSATKIKVSKDGKRSVLKVW